MDPSVGHSKLDMLVVSRLDVVLSGLHRSVLPGDFGGGWVEDVGMVHPQIAWAPTLPDEVPR